MLSVFPLQYPGFGYLGAYSGLSAGRRSLKIEESIQRELHGWVAVEVSVTV